ncbi:heterogeneous nuclear ribonucleoprotein Q-like, partial [Prunus avium]
MAEGAEVEERVDLDEDNYMEEMDDDVEEQIDEDGVDGVDGGSDENVEENAEEAHEDPTTKASEKDQSPEPDESHNAGEFVDDEEKPSASVNEEEKEKHAQLLALPPYGSEVFIGGLPKDTLEEDLRDLCDEIGEIIEIRLMQDRETGESKGYAFIGFKTKEVAQKAIEELHNKAFKGKTLRCSLSETKHRLFIGNVPKIWTEDEFRKVIEEVGPGVEHIELIKDPQNPSRNRGFAFVLYYNNACADYSRQKMSNSNFRLDGNTPTVTWADPKSTSD